MFVSQQTNKQTSLYLSIYILNQIKFIYIRINAVEINTHSKS